MLSRRVLTALSFVVILFLTPEAGLTGNAWELDQLMASMASQAPAIVKYREEKRFVFLEQKLVSTGVLKYQQPDILIREVTSPDREVYTARGTWMVIQQDGELQKEVNLADHPVAFIFMETFKAILKADLESLKQYYLIELSGRKSSWSLRLIPLDKQVLKYVESITLRGRDGHVKRIETIEVGGDSSLMEFESHVE